MRVFIAGASGALGRPLTRQLLAKGHEVFGLTTSRPQLVEQLGATPVVADAFDSRALEKAVADTSPDWVVHALTRIPKTATPMPWQFKENDRLRIEGTRNLIDAYEASGGKRFIGQSITFGFIGQSEKDMQPPRGLGRFQKTLDAAVSLEKQTLATDGGIVLRYGYFYGGSTTFDEQIPAALKRRMLPILGKGRSLWSFIHLDDAAAATIAALERGKPGEVYNICDDTPLTASDALDLVAAKAGAPRPLRLPAIAPSYVKYYFNQQTGASNAKAKAELGWAPRFPSFRQAYLSDNPEQADN